MKYPLPPDATLADVIEAVNDHEARTVVLEADDSKVHGFIAWCYEKRSVLVPIGTAIFATLSAWALARNNSLPGVVSEPTPIVKPAEQPTPTSDKLQDIKNRLKDK